MPGLLGVVGACAGNSTSVRPTQSPRLAVETKAPPVEALPRCRRDPGDLSPSRAAFFEEVLFPERTVRTPRFDAYTKGSYIVKKLDSVSGLREQATVCGVRLRAALIVGPVGPLWAFHVASLVQDSDGVRVNSLVMPHARITGKATGLVSAAEASALLDELAASPAIHTGIPSTAAHSASADAEFSYRLLLAILDGPEPRYFHATFNERSPDADITDLLTRVNRLLSAASTRTYPLGEKADPP
ncbi:MAG TPA: hypothetical protein VER96_07020 [Polyangiaceae bacterium]|nr:hypothetical protein [Polyangiaceae bacterium]